MQEFLKTLSHEMILSLCIALLTVLGFVSTSIILLAKITIKSNVEKFIKKIDSFDLDITGLKKDMIGHTLNMSKFETDIRLLLSFHKESITTSFNFVNEKLTSQITNLTILSNTLNSDTHALSEIYKANTDNLEFKLKSIVETRKEVSECYGKVILLESKTDKNSQNINKIATALKASGILKGRE